MTSPGRRCSCAGLLVAVDQLRRRRRTPEPSDDGVEAEVALRVGADPERAARLDAALRTLGRRPADARVVTCPAVYAATIDDTAVVLHLAPAELDPPARGRAQDDGRALGAARVADRSAVPRATRSRRTRASSRSGGTPPVPTC